MSTQGTGALVSYSMERQLLDSWGDWARMGGAGGGYMSMPWLRKAGPTALFSDELMLGVDATIAGLGPYYKRTIKKVFLSRRGLLIPSSQKNTAIAAFSHAWRGCDTYVLSG